MLYLLCFLGAWFGYANPVYQLPGAIILFPAGLFLLARGAPDNFTAWKRGWIAGGVAYTACLYWIAIPVHEFGPLPWVLALPCPVLIGIFLGLYPAFFALFLKAGSRTFSWPLLGLMAGLAWSSLEYARAWLLTGFPWLTLSQALSPWPWALQSIQLLGAFGLSGLLVMLTVWMASGWKRPLAWVATAFVLAAAGVQGSLAWQAPLDEGLRLNVSIIQGNIDQNRKWEREYQQRTLDKYLSLSLEEIHKESPDLLLWPETAMPFYLQEPSAFTTKVQDFTARHRIFLVTGAPGYRQQDSSYTFFNRAYLLGPEGEIRDIYGKQHLVPFGEYVPLQALLPFVGAMVAGIGDFAPGMHSAPLQLDEVALGTLICYEVIFPDLAQRQVKKGAGILINLSNDAWFGRSSGPVQHLHQAVLRSIEQNRYLLRATNTGISAIITPHGRLLHIGRLNETCSINGPEITSIDQRTFFSRHFELIRNSILLAAFILVGTGMIRSRRAG